MSTVNLTFNVYLPDAAVVRAKQEEFPDGWVHAPDFASSELTSELGYDVPLITYGEPVASPCVQTAWHKVAATGKLRTDVAVFRVKSDSFWGGIFGSNTRFIWIGRFWYAPSTVPGEITPPIEEEEGDVPHTKTVWPLALRKWIDGCELSSVGLGQGEGGTAPSACVRVASRMVDGYGLAVRSNAVARSHSAVELGAAAASDGWDRFYVKLLRAPLALVKVWGVTGTGGPGGDSIRCYVTPSGQLAFYNLTEAGAETAHSVTQALAVGVETKVDVFYKWTMTNPAPLFNHWYRYIEWEVWINGSLAISSGPFEMSDNFGAVAALTHGTSTLGTNAGGHSLEIDFDDWVGARKPDRLLHGYEAWGPGGGTDGTYLPGDIVTYAVNGVTRFYKSLIQSGEGDPHEPNTQAGLLYWTQMIGPFDLFTGTHVQTVEPFEFTVNHDAAGWPGNFRTLLRRFLGSTVTALTSTTSGAVLEVEMEAIPMGSGAGAVVVAVHGTGAAAANQLGAGIAGAAPSMAAITQDGTHKWVPRLFNVDGVITEPRVVDPLTVRLTKDATATSRAVSAIGAVVEYLGVFGACDIGPEPGLSDPPASPEVPRKPGLHNAPFPRSAHASLTSTPPFGGVFVKTGTYVGNGTGQDLTWAHAPHLALIRPVTAPAGGQKWWSSMQRGAHVGINGSPDPAGIVVVQNDITYVSAGGATDPEERYLVRIPGNNSQVNTDTVVYQYLLFSDPSARFLLNGALAHGAHALDASLSHALINDNFTPIFGWLWAEFYVDPDDTGTARSWLKGTGSAAAAASVINGAEVTPALTFGTGTITTATAVHAANHKQIAYALMRAVEPGDDSSGVAFQILKYIGNGVSPRDIPLLSPSGLSGKRPLFAIVVPDDAAAWFRDCGHLTGKSSTLGAMGAPAANGITAGGIDSITVGSSLNSTGIDYSVLVIPGSDEAGTDGWSICGEFMLKEPKEPEDWPEEPPFDDDDDDPDDDGDDDDDGGDDFDDITPLPGTLLHCKDFTQRCCNLALTRIGVSKQIIDVVEDDTKEAELARLHVPVDVEAVLARFPWEFARKYAALTLVDGSPSDPVNADWTYSYRKPADCRFERRITQARGQAINPTPPAFALGRDSGGGLIYCNVEDAALEYTARGLCPTYEGDDLFKEALVWKLGASFAPALTRIVGKSADCLAQYEQTIATAYQVIRPGNPGPATEADPDAFDQSAASTAANLSVANLALIRIGARTIASLSADSREALSVRAIFEHELRAVLRDHAWAFATRYAELALVAGAATWDDPLVQTWSAARAYEPNDAVIFGSTVYYALEVLPADPSGSDPSVDTDNWTTDEPDEANGDWLRAFRIPETSVFARRLVRPGVRRTYDPEPSTFKLGTDDGGEVLFTDAENVTLEYTARIDGVVARADALFRDALAWRLAASLAPALAQVDPEETEQVGRGPDATALPSKAPSVRANKAAARQRIAEWAMGKYLFVLEQAKVTVSNERQDDVDGDAPWIAGR